MSRIVSVVPAIIAALLGTAAWSQNTERPAANPIFLEDVPPALTASIRSACAEIAKAHPVTNQGRAVVFSLLGGFPDMYSETPPVDGSDRTVQAELLIVAIREAAGAGAIPILCSIMETSKDKLLREKASYIMGVLSGREQETYNKYQKTLFLPLWERSAMDKDKCIRRDAAVALFGIAQANPKDTPPEIAETLFHMAETDPWPGLKNVASYYLAEMGVIPRAAATTSSGQDTGGE